MLGAEIARAIVLAKIANCHVVLQRGLRDRPDGALDPEKATSSAVAALGNSLEQLRCPESSDSIRGTEGIAANIYFSVFDHLITANKEAFYFKDRNRPPLRTMLMRCCHLSIHYWFMIYVRLWKRSDWTRRLHMMDFGSVALFTGAWIET